MHKLKIRDTRRIKNFGYSNSTELSPKGTQQTSKISGQQDRRGFASFFLRWSLDKNTRLIFCIMLDVTGRNVQRFGSSVIHYWRWVEAGFLVELLRLTDFMNSLKPHKRQRLSSLASLNWMKPSEELIHDLWEVAKNRMPMAQFLRMWTQGGD